MKYEVLIPKSYIDSNNDLCDISESALSCVCKRIESELFDYSSGFIQDEVSGFYKRQDNNIYKSSYLRYTVCTSNDIDLSFLSEMTSLLHQDSIGIIKDNEFIEVV